MPRITKQRARGGNEIKNTTKVPEGGLKFSFKYIDLDGDKDFCLSLCQDGYLRTLLERLRDVNGLTALEFQSNKNKALRAHTHDWPMTKKPNGFSSLNEQLRSSQPWQFQLTANAHGRIHGFMIGETFYVVWFDPDHRLY